MGGGSADPTALTTFTTADFSGSGVCATCHTGLTDGAGRDVSIDSQWRPTMMANAAKDPLWQAKVSSEVERHPALAAVIEEKCSRCHMGMARYQAIVNGAPVAVLGSGFLAPANALHAAAMDGVSCTLCHQIQAAGLGTDETFTGMYWIDTSTSSPNRLAYGQYASPFQNPMRMMSGFTPVAGAHVTDSALCGACHTLFTPAVRADGTLLPTEFPEQTTYLEWERGSREQSCQGCHMPVADGSVVISNRPMMLAARSAFGDHVFAGANRQMLALLGSNSAALGLTAKPEHLAASLAATSEQLESRTAALALDSTEWDSSSRRLAFTVEVENKSGHKFPSGIPARRAWLHVTVADAGGTVVFESGRPADDGSIEGCAADANPAVFEPHHDVISSPEEVQIYESVMADSDGHVTQTLLRAAAYAKDNRLLPPGFDKLAAASTDVAVVGGAAFDDDFTEGRDRVTYALNVPPGTGSVTVTAELLYQSVSHPFAADLRNSHTDLVERFLGMYDASDRAPTLVAAVQGSAIDTSPPAVSISAPEDGARFTFCPRGTRVGVAFSAAEAENVIDSIAAGVGADGVSLDVSGLETLLATASGEFVARSVGTYTVLASATSAGGTGYATATFEVHYGLIWLPPVSLGKTANGGSTMPVLFTARDCTGRFVRDPSVRLIVKELTSSGEVTRLDAGVGAGADSVRIFPLLGLYEANFRTARGRHDYRADVFFGGEWQGSRSFSVR
jgi:hypothetical protein